MVATEYLPWLDRHLRRRLYVAYVLTAIVAATSSRASAQSADEESAAPSKADANAATEVGATTTDQTNAIGICVDQVIADRLAQKRKRRGAIDRLFIKQARHEVTVSGGYYNSDLFSGTYVVGGAYTFHMTEQTAVEFAGAYTHANADVIRALEDKRGQLLANNYERVVFAEAALVWSPIYGKLRFGGTVTHFDLDLALGVGVVDWKRAEARAASLAWAGSYLQATPGPSGSIFAIGHFIKTYSINDSW